jgi:hypothetical protein
MGRDYTFSEMRRALVVGWGELGGRVADCWADYNGRYWGGRLLPLPIFLTPATPYGSRFGWTCCDPQVTHIALACPHKGDVLVATRSTLLHEMTHQGLSEAGLRPDHQGQGWRDEVMRLHRLLTGQEVWAGAYVVAKEKVAGGGRQSVRLNRPDPATGRPSLTQGEIARWPRSLGIDLGAL